MKRAWIAAVIFIFLLLLDGTAVQAEETEELIGSYLDELDFGELQDSIDEMFPTYDFDFRESILKLLKGELPLSRETLQELLKEAAFAELSNQKSMVLQILVQIELTGKISVLTVSTPIVLALLNTISEYLQ